MSLRQIRPLKTQDEMRSRPQLISSANDSFVEMKVPECAVKSSQFESVAALAYNPSTQEDEAEGLYEPAYNTQ